MQEQRGGGGEINLYESGTEYKSWYRDLEFKRVGNTALEQFLKEKLKIFSSKFFLSDIIILAQVVFSFLGKNFLIKKLHM